MKRIISLCAIAIIAGTTPSLAKTWRLNPNPEAHADFTSIADAMADDRVEEGDELLLDPGSYPGAEVRKKNITITGPGYLMSTNTDWHEGRHAELTSNLSLYGNCTIQGVKAHQISLQNGGNTVTRCQIPSFSIYTDGKNDIITDNYVWSINLSAIDGFCPIITNNIVRNTITGGKNCLVEYNTVVGAVGGHLISGFKNSIIKNNIVINTLGGNISSDPNVPNKTRTINFIPDDNNTIINNVLSCPAKYADANYPNNEYVDASLSNTFIDNITGDRYLLRDDSVAKGKATDGGDCGAFGGATPYVLSGLPYGMPHITEAQIPSTPTDGKLNIKLKIATQNE